MTTKILGRTVQHDMSGGQGHCWRADVEIPANIREEIEAEILDDKRETCADYRASNGQHYRWRW